MDLHRALTGQVWRLGDNVNTDLLHPPSYFSLDAGDRKTVSLSWDNTYSGRFFVGVKIFVYKAMRPVQNQPDIV